MPGELGPPPAPPSVELEELFLLESTRVLDGDLSPLFALPRLEHVVLEDRPHYFHRAADFPELAIEGIVDWRWQATCELDERILGPTGENRTRPWEMSAAERFAALYTAGQWRKREVALSRDDQGTTRSILEPRRRPLTPAEHRLLRCKIRRNRARPGEVDRGVGYIVAGVTVVLWLLTLLAADAPWPLVTIFWLVLGWVLYVWVRRDLRRETAHLPAMASSMESALRRDEAESFDIVAEAYAEFEEVEDEGACYAFDLGDGRIVFLAGQEFYPSARFPSLDFSIVYPLDESGRSADMWIEKRGETTPPDRRIPGRVKWELAERLPESLEVVRGSLDRVEETLRSS